MNYKKITKGLYLDKSILTGETENVEASIQKCNIDDNISYFDATNMAFTNCLVVLGEGMGLVVELSTNTDIDQIFFKKLKPVKQRKRGVIQELSKFIILIFILCLVGVIIYLVVYIAYLRPLYNPSAADTLNDIISIVVAGTPYGMPISITVGLFLVSRQLKKGKILVKNVFAIDALSSVDVIITDKTGTITRNELVVSNVMQAMKEIDPELCSFDEANDQVIYIIFLNYRIFCSNDFRKK
jgi:sodium/potassium-transporting ATPase subunit alpha